MVDRDELEQALEHFRATVRRAYANTDWELFGSLFTEDADYLEHSYGRFHGRADITEWAVRTMTSFPGNAMIEFPITWAVYDTERAWIVCEIQNVMPDPGDGSCHESPNLTVLHYAGDGLFSYEQDVYNPLRFVEMVVGWARIARAHDRLPADGEAWLARFGPRT